MGKYDDIIHLPHHVSDYHTPMPRSKRAAQFAPFAALSGHEDKGSTDNPFISKK